MENPIKMDDLGIPQFSETSMFYSKSLSYHPKETHVFIGGNESFRGFIYMWEKTEKISCKVGQLKTTSKKGEIIPSSIHRGEKTLLTQIFSQFKGGFLTIGAKRLLCVSLVH